jgi:SHS2 domain-containing protein
MREINNNQDRKFIEVDHPSDIGIRFFGDNLEELFEKLV